MPHDQSFWHEDDLNPEAELSTLTASYKPVLLIVKLFPLPDT